MEKRLIRMILIVVVTLFAVGVEILFPLMVPTRIEHAIKLAAALGEASTVLFGIFGVWLGICYRENIETMTAGKQGDDLRQTAEEVADRAERCKVLFTGLLITSIVFVMSVIVRSFEPTIVSLCQTHLTMKNVFCVCVFSSVVFLVFGILSPVAIMLHAMDKVRRAAESAEETLRLTGRSSN